MRGRITLAFVMAASLVPAAAVAAPDAAGWQHGLEGIDQGTVRAIGLDPALGLPLPGSEIFRLDSVVPDDQMKIFTRVTRWKRLTIVALGINTGAVLITLVDPFAANILGILSLGFFTISSGYMASGYRDLIEAQALTAEIEPDPRFPYMA